MCSARNQIRVELVCLMSFNVSAHGDFALAGRVKKCTTAVTVALTFIDSAQSEVDCD